MSSSNRTSHSGRLVIISGPSGVGKSSIVRELLKKPGRALSVSATTRAPRPGEIDGVHYHFLSGEEFDQRVRDGWFAEHAQVHSHSYGTPRGPLEEALRTGTTFLLDIDVQGADRLKQRYPKAVSIFVLPPDFETLEKRLRGRKTDSAEAIERRLKRAQEEIARHVEFDHRVVNDDLTRVVRETELILHEK